MRFFRYITDIAVARTDSRFPEKTENNDEFEFFRTVYAQDRHVDSLFSVLNSFSEIYKKEPDFFRSVFYVEPEDFSAEKTRLFFQNPSADLFKKCADCYDPLQRNNPFSIGEQLLLYACIVHKQNETPDFNTRVRKLRNFIENSEEVRKEYLPNLLHSVHQLITDGMLNEDSKFNKTQIQEEEQKALFIQANPGMHDVLCRLEDHPLLRGCTAIFELTSQLADHARQFEKLFYKGCDYDTISRALLTFGDYSQGFGGKRKFGNKKDSVWRELFTPSVRRRDFQNTKNALNKIWGAMMENSSVTPDTIISSYLALFDEESSKEKDWRYYFIRYDGFRKHTEGYYWINPLNPYECVMISRKTLWSSHWSPFLYTMHELKKDQTQLDKYLEHSAVPTGAPLIFARGNITIKITNVKGGFKLAALDGGGQALLNRATDAGLISPECICPVRQSPEGFDMEDRVEKGIELIDLFDKFAQGVITKS